MEEHICIKRRRLVMGFFSAAVCAAFAGKPKTAQASASVEVLQVFLSKAKGAVGRFKETVYGKDGKQKSTAEGEFAFSRPGRFRWTYTKPYAQTIVCDGKKLWIYDEDLMQVTIKPVDGTLPQTPAAILFGGDNLEKDWTLSAETRGNDQTAVKAVPKVESGFESVEIVFSADGEPLEMTLCDLFGQRTRYAFESFKLEMPDASRFTFEPPAGVDVNDMSGIASG